MVLTSPPDTKLKEPRKRVRVRRFHNPEVPKGIRLSVAALKYLGIALVVYLLIGPVGTLVAGAFRTSPLAVDAEWTLSGFETIFSDSRIWGALGTSLTYSGVVTLAALVLATFFAIVNVRTMVPGRGLITPLMVTLAVIPNLFYVLAWSMLGSSDGGLFSAFFSVIGWAEGSQQISATGWAGLLIVTIMKVTGLAYLLLLGPVRNLDPGFEDAAVMCGVPRMAAFRQITIPSLTPALGTTGALLFVSGLETFEIPAVLGRPVGIEPLSIFIYGYLDSDLQPNYAAASALSLIFVIAVAFLLFLQIRMTGKRDFTTVGGKARQHAPIPLGSGVSLAITAGIVLFAVFSIMLPLLQIVVGSFQGYFGGYDSWTLSHYINALDNSRMNRAITATLLIAVLGGAISACLTFVLVYVIHRKKGTRLSLLFKIATWVPATAPGIVLSIALLWMYLYTPGLRELFGTPWMMMLALIVATLPVAARAIEGSVVQISSELEESSKVAGASSPRAIFDVTARLCLPSILSAWLLVGLIMSGRLDIPLILQSTGNQTITTLTYAMYGRGQIAEAAASYCLYLVLLTAIFAVVMACFSLYRRRLNGFGSPLKKGNP